MIKYYLFVVFAILFGLPWCSESFEENKKFCIRTEPILLSDIEKRLKTSDDKTNCDIVATTLTVNEKVYLSYFL